MEKKKLEQLKKTLRQAHDALESMTDSDLDYFEDEEEEAEYAPTQFAARKIQEVIDELNRFADAPQTYQQEK